MRSLAERGPNAARAWVIWLSTRLVVGSSGGWAQAGLGISTIIVCGCASEPSSLKTTCQSLSASSL